MASITLAQPMAMATTQLARVTHYEDAPEWQLEDIVERNALSMSWVVVTDENGSGKLQMQWTRSADPSDCIRLNIPLTRSA